MQIARDTDAKRGHRQGGKRGRGSETLAKLGQFLEGGVVGKAKIGEEVLTGW